MLNVRVPHIINLNMKRVGTSMTFRDNEGIEYDTTNWEWMGNNPHNDVGENYLALSHNTKYRDIKDFWYQTLDVYCVV